MIVDIGNNKYDLIDLLYKVLLNTHFLPECWPKGRKNDKQKNSIQKEEPYQSKGSSCLFQISITTFPLLCPCSTYL